MRCPKADERLDGEVISQVHGVGREGVPITGHAKIIDVNADNVEETGFFCYMSKRQSEGYKRKHEWLMSRFAEGMKIKMIREGGRGFIEYLPGEHAWRPVEAGGYMFVHCIWIVGQSKGKGVGRLLLNECINDARKAGMAGVAMATSEGTWLVGGGFLERMGFQSVDQAPPSFRLMARKFRTAPSPTFTGRWEEKMRKLGRGLTIVRTDQCPYVDASVKVIVEAAKELGIKSQVVELRTSQEVREQAPSAYGVFSVVYNGMLLSYHPMGKSDFVEKLSRIRGETGS